MWTVHACACAFCVRANMHAKVLTRLRMWRALWLTDGFQMGTATAATNVDMIEIDKADFQ